MGITNQSVTQNEPDDPKPIQSTLKTSEDKSEEKKSPPKKLSVSNLSTTQTDFSSIIIPKDNGNGNLYTHSKVKNSLVITDVIFGFYKNIIIF